MNNSLYLIADINSNIFSINPAHIESITNPDKRGEVITNDIEMISGTVFTVPVQLIILMLNTADITVYDLISPKMGGELAEGDLDVNDTEYVDDTPLEEVSDKIKVEPYDDNYSDGHTEFTDYITAYDDLPDDNVSVEGVIEGSEANG